MSLRACYSSTGESVVRLYCEVQKSTTGELVDLLEQYQRAVQIAIQASLLVCTDCNTGEFVGLYRLQYRRVCWSVQIAIQASLLVCTDCNTGEFVGLLQHQKTVALTAVQVRLKVCNTSVQYRLQYRRVCWSVTAPQDSSTDSSPSETEGLPEQYERVILTTIQVSLWVSSSVTNRQGARCGTDLVPGAPATFSDVMLA